MTSYFEPKPANFPKHIAIVMDGNGRWANARNLPRTEGHKVGLQALKTTLTAAVDFGVEYLTVWGFSTENWARPATEVSALMMLFRQYLKSEIKELHKNNIRLRVIGDIDRFDKDIADLVRQSIELTKANTGLQFTVALSYGGRDEIVRAVKAITSQVQDGTLQLEDISESSFAPYLYTHDVPDPDLFIRPSGEHRLSNFLLWQLAYAELYFTEVLWPDFGAEDLKIAIEDFMKRERRFGKSYDRVA